MQTRPDLRLINDKIQQIKKLLNELNKKANCQNEFPFLAKNSKRALASIKMMEFGLCDLVEFDLI
jgi:hypothetical protein